MSFLSSLINVFTSFALQIVNGFTYQPVTKLRQGSIFTDMETAINYVDQTGQFFLGQGFGSSSVMSRAGFEQAPPYQPGDTTPPRTYPTSQPNGYVVPLGVNDASMYHLSAEGLRHLKAFEGLHQRLYTINGQKYIGYGHKMSEGDVNTYISRDEADAMLAGDVGAAEGLVKGAVSGQLTQGQFDALVDFAYTTTAQKFKNSTVVQKFNSGDIPGAATALAQWVYTTQNGIVSKVPHLAARRTSNVHWLTMPADVQPPS